MLACSGTIVTASVLSRLLHSNNFLLLVETEMPTTIAKRKRGFFFERSEFLPKKMSVKEEKKPERGNVCVRRTKAKGGNHWPTPHGTNRFPPSA